VVGDHAGWTELLPLIPAGPHGGDGWRFGPDVLDVSANLHPGGPPPGVWEACVRALGQVGRYPPPAAEPLREALRARIGVEVVVGNGATELLVAAVRGARRVRLDAPCYGGYAEAARVAGVPHGYDGRGDLLVVGRPNNPDGRMPSVAQVADLARRWERVVVDESFLAFTAEPSCVGVAPNVVVVTSMTKTFAIPGLRLGWAWNLPVDALPPWSVNAVALEAGLVCAEAWDWPRRAPIDRWRAELRGGLARWGTVDGAANFLRLTLPAARAAEVRSRALERGVLVRDASTIPGCDGRHLRVAVRAPEENQRTLEALGHALG
jgi:threonine-phosphate decarboxylase